MAVKYVRLNPVVDMFAPAVRSTGNIAIIGTATAGTATADRPVQVTSPSMAVGLFGTPGTPDNSMLTRAIQLAFQQSPGPSQVWGVKSGSDVGTALTAIEELDVQFVVLANTTLTATSGATGGAIGKLVAHVVAASTTGSDGKERMGVAMLAKGDNTTTIAGALSEDRMVYVAHNSDDDAAAAVAATIAGYPPHVSMLLKPVSITSTPFTSAQIDAINGAEGTDAAPTAPAGRGIVWLATPALIPGGGVYLGEGYNGKAGGKKYIDVVRTLDDVSFKLKARLIRSIGTLRISRSGLRSLVVQMEAVLNPLQADGVIEGYDITVPVLDLLDADPASLTPTQLTQIDNAQTDRFVQVLASVDYAGAIHRLAITLKFR